MQTETVEEMLERTTKAQGALDASNWGVVAEAIGAVAVSAQRNTVNLCARLERIAEALESLDQHHDKAFLTLFRRELAADKQEASDD